MTDTYHPYLHVERLGRPEVQGILDGTVYVQPKIDGTNAVVWATLNEDNPDGPPVLHAGSRKREITPENDNAGFAAWLMTSTDPMAVALTGFAKAHPGYTIYGEWLGNPTDNSKMVGALKAYTEKGFFIFDVRDPDGNYLGPTDPIVQKLRDTSIPYLEPLAVLNNPTVEQLHELADNNHYLLPETVTGEGIVLKNYAYRDSYGHVAMAKIVHSEFHDVKARRTRVKAAEDYEEKIVEEYVTPTFIDKAQAKARVMCSNAGDAEPKLNKLIGITIQIVLTDLVEEELVEALKKYKWPALDFSQIKRLTAQKVADALRPAKG